jgi:acyl dehydratase
MAGLWFEDFHVGAAIQHARSLAVTQDDNEAFCRLTHNTQPLHFDADAARAQGFDDVLVNGLYTFAASVGMTVPETTEGTLVANLGYEDVRHPAPVYPGDTLSASTEVVEKRASSKGGRGIVRLRHTVAKQDRTVVCSYDRIVLVRARPASS